MKIIDSCKCRSQFPLFLDLIRQIAICDDPIILIHSNYYLEPKFFWADYNYPLEAIGAVSWSQTPYQRPPNYAYFLSLTILAPSTWMYKRGCHLSRSGFRHCGEMDFMDGNTYQVLELRVPYEDLDRDKRDRILSIFSRYQSNELESRSQRESESSGIRSSKDKSKYDYDQDERNHKSKSGRISGWSCQV